MKKINNIIKVLTFTTLAFVACRNDEFDDKTLDAKPEKQVFMTFKAGTVKTRTILKEDNSVYWQANDEISVLPQYDTGNLSNDKFVTSDNAAGATFSGMTSEVEKYVAIYPYSKSLYNIIRSGEIGFVNVNLPNIQQAMQGTFSPELNLSCAVSTVNTEGEKIFNFHNLCTLIKFRMTGNVEDITTIVLADKTSGRCIAGSGTLYVDASSLKPKSISNGANTYNSITLKAPESGFIPNTDYYFTAFPVSTGVNLSDGFSITFLYEDGRSFEKSTEMSMNVEAGKIINLGNIEVGEAQELPIITNKDIIANAEKHGAVFDKNSDGTVTLTQRNLQVVKNVTSITLNGYKISDFSDIRYFTGLTYLDCSNNQISSLDVSMMLGLRILYCSQNQLTSLDLSKQTELTTLNCMKNRLTELDLTNNEKLTGSLNCGNQTSDGSTIQQMNLYLPAALHDKWNDKWVKYANNNYVTLVVE